MSEDSAQISPIKDGASTPPEGGVSLVRTGSEGEMLQNRLERPAKVGRMVMAMLGIITAGAGVADWITTGSAVGIAIAAFGGVLLALGVIQHILYKRDLQHWPKDVVLWDEGIELMLSNGEVRGMMWSDPDVALQLVARKAPAPAEREYLLLWLPDSKIPAVELSAEGYDRIAKIAAESHLQISMTRRGPRVGGTQMIQIRQLPPPTTRPISKSMEPNG